MNINVKISITDIERNTLAKHIFNKETKALASRCDVNEFLKGCLSIALINDGSPHAPLVVNNKWEKLQQQLTAEGRNESYIRGAKQVFHACHN